MVAPPQVTHPALNILFRVWNRFREPGSNLGDVRCSILFKNQCLNAKSLKSQRKRTFASQIIENHNFR